MGENCLEIMKPLPGSDFVQATETGWDSMDASDEQLYRELKWLVPTTSLSTYVTAGRWHRKLLQVDLELIKAEVFVFIRHHVNHVLKFRTLKNVLFRGFMTFLWNFEIQHGTFETGSDRLTDVKLVPRRQHQWICPRPRNQETGRFCQYD